MLSDSSYDSATTLDLRLGNVPGPPLVAIFEAPPSLTNQTTASFTFATASTPPPGVYECSLDNAAFGTCTSPMPYGGLAEGQHSFRVRFHPDGESPGDATERTWTVDTTPPVVTIDEAPSGSGNPPDATIKFSSSEPAGATFECVLDDEPAATCTSPHVLNGLSNGQHAFSVKARDAAGNQSTAAEAGWGVTDPGSCGTGAIPIGFAKACGATLDETEPGSKIYKTANRAWVGGFEIVPRPDGMLVVDRNTNELRAEGAGVEVVWAGRVIPFPLPTIPVGEQEADVGFGGGGSISLFGLPIEAEASVKWTDGGAASDLELKVKVEELAGLLGPVSGVATELKAKQANGTGFQLTSAKVEANGEVTIIPSSFGLPRPLKLKSFSLAYELKDGKDFWVGQAGLELPLRPPPFPGSPPFEITGKLSIYDGRFAGVGLKVDGFNKPIPSTPVFLQSVEGEVLFRPSLGADIGATGTLGPKIGDIELTTFTGNIRAWALAEGCSVGTDPIQIAYTAEVKPLKDLGVGEASLKGQLCIYYTSPAMDVSNEIELSFGDNEDNDQLGFEGKSAGFMSTTAFNLGGEATLKIPGLPDLEGKNVLSNTGIAACADIFGIFDGGFGYAWTTSVPTAFSGCDLTPWTTQAPTASAGASGSTRTVRVPSGIPLAGFRVVGRKGPPRVRVRGPKGERLTGRAKGHTLKRRRALIVPVAGESATYVFVRNPSAGTWRVESLQAGNPIKRIQSARGLPDPVIKAQVRPRTRGAKRTLIYTVRRLPGQRVQFFERAAGIARRIGVTRKRRGKVRFRPAVSTIRKRRIEALVLQNGLPRTTLTVARFRAAAP